MVISYLALGSNLGDRQANIQACYGVLESLGVFVLKKSDIYETAPWGHEDQASFLNQVLMVETDLSPEVLVAVCKEAEKQIGRIDSFKWGPRVIDIDVLFYGDQVMEKPNCTIPHHLMHERRFVLEPLCEIAPDFVHPVFKKTACELLENCEDRGRVVKVA